MPVYRDGQDKPGHDQLGIATTLPLLRQNGRMAERSNSFKLLGFVGPCLFRGMLTNLHPCWSSGDAQGLR